MKAICHYQLYIPDGNNQKGKLNKTMQFITTTNILSA